MCCTERRPLRKSDGNAIAHPTVGQEHGRAFDWRFHADWRQQKRDGRARTNDIAQPNTAIGTGREVERTVALDVVTHNADPVHVVMEPIERGGLELRQPLWNEATQLRQAFGHSSTQAHVDAMGQEVPPSKLLGVSDQFIERQADGGIVGCHNRPRARSNDDIDGDVVVDQLLQHAHMAGAAQAAATQHETDANLWAFH